MNDLTLTLTLGLGTISLLLAFGVSERKSISEALEEKSDE